MTQSTEKKRLVQLDILRGVAILLVLGCHFVRYTEFQKAGALEPVANFFYRSGWIGVDLFFVLSGFLIGGLLFQELKTHDTLDVQRFLVRRAWKIWPLYFVYLAVMTARHAVTHHSLGNAFSVWWPNWLQVQNYFLWQARPHTWSLAVEEHFYIALPIVLLLLSRYSLAKKPQINRENHSTLSLFPWVAGGVMIFCLALRLWVSLHHDNLQSEAYTKLFLETHTRADSLFFGVLLAYIKHFEPQKWQVAAHYKSALFAVGMMLISPMVFIAREDSSFISTWGYSLLYVGFGSIMVALISTTPSDGAAGRLVHGRLGSAVAYIGLFSFPIYVWHFDMASLPSRWLVSHNVLGGLPVEARWSALLIAHGLLAIAAGMFWSLVLEKPTLTLRERFCPARAISSVPVPSLPNPQVEMALLLDEFEPQISHSYASDVSASKL